MNEGALASGGGGLRKERKIIIEMGGRQFKYSVNERVVSTVIRALLSVDYKRCVIGRTADRECGIKTVW